MYAIIAAGGKQYKVTNGDVVKFEKLEGNVGDKVEFDQVLLVSEDKITVGDPLVANATVSGEIVEQGKDKKVIVYKYKSKTGYHKKNGHRQPITVVKIDKVILNGVELKADEKAEPAKEEKKAKPKKTAKKAEKKSEKKAEEKVEETKAAEVEEAAEEATEAEEVKAEEEVINAEAAVEEAKEMLEDAKEASPAEDAAEEAPSEE